MHAPAALNFPLQFAAALRHLGALLAAPAASAPHFPRSVRLAPGEMWIRTGLEGFTVICRSGCLWLAHDQDRQGTVLQPGDAHRVERAGRLVAQALIPVELAVVESR